MTKIIFKEMSLRENIEYIKWSYNVNNDLMSPHYYTLLYFPELKQIKAEEINNKIEKVVTDRYNSKKEEIKKEVERYNNLWKPYNEKYIEVLSKYLNTSFTKDIIEVHVGLMPVNPRDINNASFDLDINIPNDRFIDVCAHEICHFIWFKKWEELYPTITKENYNSGVVWQYSEIVVDPILNSNEVNNVLKVKCMAYDNFYKMKNNDTYVIDKLRDIYKEDISIENKIIKGYEYIKTYLEKAQKK